MEKVCTCSEQAISSRRHSTVSAKTSKELRPNGSAVRGLWYHRSGSRSSILLKERRPSIKGQVTESFNQKPTSLPLEKCISKVTEHDKLLPPSAAGEKCSRLCEGGGVCVESYKLPSRHHVTSNSSYSSSSSEPWEEDIVLRHIKECRCTCNHMGYGNYMDWEETARLGEVPSAAPGTRTYGAADSTLQTCAVKLGQCAAMSKPNTPGDGSLRLDAEIASDKDSSCKKQVADINLCACASESETDTDAEPAEVDPLRFKKGFIVHGTTHSEGSAQRSWCLACMLLILLTLTGVGVVLPLTARVRHGGIGSDHLGAVKRMLRETPLVDGHNDLAWNLRKFVHNQLHKFNFSADLRQVPPWSTTSWSQTDLPRLQEGMLGAQFWSAYVPCDAQFKDAVQLTLEQINVIRRLIDGYSALQFVTTAEGVEQAHRQGRIASLIGVEGGHSLGASLGVLRAMHDLGVRYLTLTHTCHTPWADSSSGAASESNTNGQGLTAFGKVVIHELNRLGVVVDLSHAALETVIATLNATRSPVIFSHSSAQALCNTSRNVPDSVLKLMADNGGVVMVSFYNDFLTCSQTARMEDVMRE